MKNQFILLKCGAIILYGMKTTFYQFHLTVPSILLIVLLLFSCKKSKLENEDVSPKMGSRTELTIDSLFLYAKEAYLWNESLPSYISFAPRDRYNHILSEAKALEDEMFDISQFKINQKTNLPYEFTSYGSPKYSHIEIGLNGNIRAKTAFQKQNSKSDLIVSHSNNLSYFAIHSFPELIDIQTDLEKAFSEIAAHRPSTIVIDLRNNGGGYIESAEYLANLIAPSRLNGKVMYSECYNQTLQSGKAKILKNQPFKNANGKYVIRNGRQTTLADVDYSERGNTHFFNKKGKLESIKNIYFITSGKTASASELLISLFKPYFAIKLVGEKTYGKPVGFFEINIDRYSVSFSNFLIKNATGWFDYFENMKPDIPVILLSNSKLGDPDEVGLKSILSDLYGDLTIAVKQNKATFSKNYNQRSESEKISINGLIENRLRLKD